MMPIRIAARMLGVHPNTLRAWERQGIIRAARTASGHRRYAREEIYRVQGKMAKAGNTTTPKTEDA